MKLKIQLYILLALVTLGELTAQSFEVDGISYNILNTTDVEVTSKTNCYDGNIIIPSTVDYMSNTYNVTAIGYEAFNNCDITEITLPNSLTKIEDYAFRDCRDMKAINIPDSVTSIGFGAFLYCTIMESVNIPEGITTIDRFTFGYCIALKSISIPESVTSIGTYAFSNCSGLITVNSYVVSPINISEHMFWNLDLSGIVLNVPAASVTAYSNSSVWQDFVVINGTLNIDSLEKKLDIKLFPNPVTNNISISGLKTAENYKIYDVLGKQVSSGVVSNNTPIHIENYVSGLYFLKIENSNAIKFIKK